MHIAYYFFSQYYTLDAIFSLKSSIKVSTKWIWLLSLKTEIWHWEDYGNIIISSLISMINYRKKYLRLLSSLLINFWVNYKIGSYHLHHISIWSLTFQLCQFCPKSCQFCVNLVLVVILWMEKRMCQME